MRTPAFSNNDSSNGGAAAHRLARGRGAALLAAVAVLWATLPLAGCQSGGGGGSPKASKKKPPVGSVVTSGDGRAVEYANPAVVQERSASAKRSGPSQARGGIFGNEETALNDCAERLHSLCGPLLFYYLQNHHLPPTLQDLPSDGPEPMPPLLCPESHKPYVYALKDAIPIDNPKGYIIVHDPVPAHGGVRWCIVASSGETPSEPIIVKSVGIKEERFAVLRTKAITERQQLEREQQKQPAK